MSCGTVMRFAGELLDILERRHGPTLYQTTMRWPIPNKCRPKDSQEAPSTPLRKTSQYSYDFENAEGQSAFTDTVGFANDNQDLPESPSFTGGGLCHSPQKITEEKKEEATSRLIMPRRLSIAPDLGFKDAPVRQIQSAKCSKMKKHFTKSPISMTHPKDNVEVHDELS